MSGIATTNKRGGWPAIKTALGSLWEAGLGLFYPNVCQVCRDEPAFRNQGYVGDNCHRQIQLLLPPYCSRCGLPPDGAVTGHYVCGNCRDTKFNFVSARAAARVNDTLLEILHRYKYQGALYFEPFLAELLASQAVPALGRQWDLIVPTPLHPTKLREREFNQAERLAAALSRASGIPMDKRLVQRVLPTPSQTRLDRAQRRKNMRDAFAPIPGAQLTGKRVVLIDDILTTCATTDACAKALRQAGAATICVWAVARTI